MRKIFLRLKYWLLPIAFIVILFICAQCLAQDSAQTFISDLPLSVACDNDLPMEVQRILHEKVDADPSHFTWADSTDPQILIGLSALPESKALGTWTYAVAAPFFTVIDEVSLTILQQLWQGTSGERPIFMTEETLGLLSVKWGEPSGGLIRTAAARDLLDTAAESEGWAIIPFHQLSPKWKVLRVDGISLLEKSGDLDSYPLTLSFYASSVSSPEVLNLPSLDELQVYNRDQSLMTILAMTGVTAMTRRTAQLMDRAGVTYPSKDIKHWFSDADFVHISNEVSFDEDYIDQDLDTMSFCSKDSYIELLESIHTNIIELTGNHLVDKGIAPLLHTFELYKERGWSWYGGGENLEDASRPLTLTDGVNKIALFGANTTDAPYDWAIENLPGVASARLPDRRALDPEKLTLMQNRIKDLKAQGYQIIITLQYYETYTYVPFPQQIHDFRTFAEMGADYVQGSQAHQPQTMEFHGDSFIHYGLGNFFFDQMWSPGTRQEFVNRLVFYNGALLSIDLRTALLEEFGRPRPMTLGDPDPAGDRGEFLQMIFDLRPVVASPLGQK